jgi:hypothetical protein
MYCLQTSRVILNWSIVLKDKDETVCHQFSEQERIAAQLLPTASFDHFTILILIYFSTSTVHLLLFSTMTK